jgi:hypothetical protein
MNDIILSFGDQHIRDIASFIPYNMMDTNGLTKELNNKILGWKFVANQIRLYKPKIVINHGDIVQSTENQSAQVIHAMSLCFKLVRDACKDVNATSLLFPGNHDFLSENRLITNIGLCEAWVDHFILTTDYINIKDYRISVIPYCSNTGKVYMDLQDGDVNSDLQVTHHDFKNCMYESGIRSYSHLDPTGYNKPIISGDIHVPQTVGSVHYIGSLLQDRFSQDDLNYVGGVLLMDMHTNEVTRIPNNLSKHYVRVRDIDKFMNKDISPDRCVLQVITNKNNDEVAEIFKGYEYNRVPLIEERSTDRIIHKEFSMSDPADIMRGYVSEDNPNALDEFELVMREKK